MKKLGLIIAVVVIAVAIGACLYSFSPLAPTVSAKEIRDKAVEALANVTTVDASLEMKMSFMGQEISMTGRILVDYVDKEMAMNVTLVMPPTPETLIIMYYVNETMYMGMSQPPEAPPSWVKIEVPIEQLETAFTPLNASIADIEVEYLGSEVVDEVDCYILALKPNISEVWKYALMLNPELAQLVGNINVSEVIKKLDIKIWISKSDYMLKREVVDMRIEYMGVAVDTTMTITINAYNTPIEITVPQEAREAQPIMLVKAFKSCQSRM